MTTEASTNLDIQTRTGWPPELRVLLEQYPREVWPDHENLGQLARFWLQIHDGFRSHAKMLRGSAHEFREGLVTPERFRSYFAPRLQTFLGHLEGHHQIEDYQFFPTFSAVEPRLVRGFDTLELDHGTIHHAMERLAETSNAFMQAPAGDSDKMRYAGDDFVDSSEYLIKFLDRHLGDEEDLIIPVILDRTEGVLGF